MREGVNHMKKVIVAGSLVLDIIPEAREDNHLNLSGGKQTHLKKIDMTVGGCVGNTGVALHKMGLSVLLVSKIGADPSGEIVQRTLTRQGCAVRLLVDKNFPTSSSVILIPPDNNRIILHGKGASQNFRTDDIEDWMLKDVALFHFGYPPTMRNLWSENARGCTEMLQKIHRHGIVTSLDMCSINMKENSIEECRTALANILPVCDIFMPSIEDVAPVFFDSSHNLTTEHFTYLSGLFIESGAAIVVVKAGKNGLYLRTAGEKRLSHLEGILCESDIRNWADKELWAPAMYVPHVASTTGAGDVAVAGFLAGLLHSKDPMETLLSASHAAAFSLKTFDATSGIPDYSQIESQISCDAVQESTDIDMNGWQKSGCILRRAK